MLELFEWGFLTRELAIVLQKRKKAILISFFTVLLRAGGGDIVVKFEVKNLFNYLTLKCSNRIKYFARTQR